MPFLFFEDGSPNTDWISQTTPEEMVGSLREYLNTRSESAIRDSEPFGLSPLALLTLAYQNWSAVTREAFHDALLLALSNVTSNTSTWDEEAVTELIKICGAVLFNAERREDGIDSLLALLDLELSKKMPSDTYCLALLGALQDLSYRGTIGFWEELASSSDSYAYSAFDGIASISPSEALDWALHLSPPELGESVIAECLPGLLNDLEPSEGTSLVEQALRTAPAQIHRLLLRIAAEEGYSISKTRLRKLLAEWISEGDLPIEFAREAFRHSPEVLETSPDIEPAIKLLLRDEIAPADSEEMAAEVLGLATAGSEQ